MSKAKAQQEYFLGVLKDLENDKAVFEAKAQKENQLKTLDWRGQQAILFGYLPLEQLKGTTTAFTFANLSALAKNNDKIAQFELGRCFIHGIAVKKDEETAKFWFKKSADNDYIPAKYALANLVEKTDPKLAFRLVVEAANGNYAAAQSTLGKYYLLNHMVEPHYNNICVAFFWFQKASEQNEERSFQNLKTCLKYFREYHIPYPQEVNLSFLEETNIVTLPKYDFDYRRAEALKKLSNEEIQNITQTAGLLFKMAEACATKRVEQQKLLSNKHPQKLKLNTITTNDLKEAWVMIHTQRKSPVPAGPSLENCLFDAARCFFYGFGLNGKTNPEIGILYCNVAIAFKFAPAEEFLASYFKHLAKNMNDKAATNKSIKPESIKAYYDKAFMLYSEAASKGFAKAEVNLALFYHQGLAPVPPAKATSLAFTWFMRAAHQGQADAQKWANYCIQFRLGVPKDLQEALPELTKILANRLVDAGNANGVSINGSQTHPEKQILSNKRANP